MKISEKRVFIGLNCPYFEKRRIVNCENIRKAQITIPKSIITSMKLNTGDKLDVFGRDGMIFITPVVVYPKNYVDELHSEVQTIKADIEAGRKPVIFGKCISSRFLNPEESG